MCKRLFYSFLSFIYSAASVDVNVPPSLRESKSLSDSSDLEPITNIIGTKLYTGIYYKVGMKVFPKGWITWTERRNYIEIELDPSQLPNYEPGKPFERDNQWSFGVTESQLGYTLTNRGKPSGFLIWVNAGAGSGNHVSVYDDAESIRKMSAGGEWRKDASWIPQSTDEDSFYKLENLAYRGNFLTWTYAKHNDFNYYIQMVSYDAKKDGIFSFQPTGIRLDAKISDFRYSLSPDDILKRNENLNRSLVAKKHFPNFNDTDIVSTVQETTETTDSIEISFKESLKMMRRIVIGIGDKEYSFDGGFESNKPKSFEMTSKLPLEKEIKIPPYSYMEVDIYTIVATNVEIPFTARMSIAGLTDRIVVNRPNEVREGNVPVDVLEHFFKTSGGEKLEIVTRFRDNLILQVSGVIKGNVGLKAEMNTKEIQIWTQPSTQSAIIWD